MVELLLELGEDILEVSGDGRSALHFAAEMGHVEVVRRMLKTNPSALVKLRSGSLWTALHFAAEQGGTEVVKLLLEVNIASLAFLVHQKTQDS